MNEPFEAAVYSYVEEAARRVFGHSPSLPPVDAVGMDCFIFCCRIQIRVVLLAGLGLQPETGKVA